MFDVADLRAKVSADHAPFDRGMDQVDRRMDESVRHADSAGSAFGSTFKRVGLVAAAGLGIAGTAAGVLGLNFYKVQQQATIAFTTMLGDGAKARAFLQELADFASHTPFEFPGLVQSAQKLMAMGFSADEVIPKLTAIGDAVAGLGGSPEVLDRVTIALGQMLAKGRVSAEEMMQLTEAGIPAWDILAKKIGVSVPEAMDMVQARAVDSRMAVDALADGMEKRFGGMMEASSHTLAGLWSTFKDTVSQISATLLTPMFDLFTSGLERVNDFLGRIAEAGTTRARIRVVWEGAQGAAAGLWDAIHDEIMGSAGTRKPLRLPTGQILEWETTGAQVGLVATLQQALQGVDWDEIGQTVGEGISAGIGETSDFVGVVLDQAYQFLSQHQQDFAELGAEMLLRIVSTLTDPGFWLEHWQLALTVALAVFPFGRILSIGGRMLEFLLGPLTRRLGPELAIISGRAVDWMIRQFSRLPLAVQEIIVDVVELAWRQFSRFGTFIRVEVWDKALAKIPGWIKMAFRIGFFLEFVAGIEAGFHAIVGAAASAVSFVLSMLSKFLGGFADVMHTLGKAPGPFGAPFRAAASAADAAKGRVDALRGAIERAAGNYDITFHTNADAVREHIQLMSGAARAGSGDYGVISFPGVAGGLVDVGRQLQAMGFQVGENPAFGGVTAGAHTENSYHYRGRAIDINWPGGGYFELTRLRQAFAMLSALPHVELLLEDVGQQNQHLHFAMAQGGWIREPVRGIGLRSGATYDLGERGPEYVSPGGMPGNTFILNAPNYVGDKNDLRRMLQEMTREYERRNGRGMI